MSGTTEEALAETLTDLIRVDSIIEHRDDDKASGTERGARWPGKVALRLHYYCPTFTIFSNSIALRPRQHSG